MTSPKLATVQCATVSALLWDVHPQSLRKKPPHFNLNDQSTMKSSSLENKALQTQLLGSLNKEQPCSPSPWFSLKRGQKAWRGVCCVVNLLWVTDLVVFLMCQVHEEHLEVVGPWAPSVQDAIFPSSSCPTLLSWNCTCSLKVPWAAWLGVGQAEPKWFWKEAAEQCCLAESWPLGSVGSDWIGWFFSFHDPEVSCWTC